MDTHRAVVVVAVLPFIGGLILLLAAVAGGVTGHDWNVFNGDEACSQYPLASQEREDCEYYAEQDARPY